MKRLWPLIFFSFCACREQILHGLDEAKANKAQLLLLRASIETEKIRQGKEWAIAVDSSEIPRALAILEHFRLLRRAEKTSAESTGGLLQSADERRREQERETCGRVEQSLEQLPGVLEARVHLAGEKGDALSFSPGSGKRSASVLLILETGTSVDLPPLRSFLSGTLGVAADSISVMSSETKESGAEVVPVSVQDKTRGVDFLFHQRAWIFPSLLLLAFGAFGYLLLAERRRREERLLGALRFEGADVPHVSLAESAHDPFRTEEGESLLQNEETPQ